MNGDIAVTPEIQVVLSGTLTFGVPLLLAIHELAVLRRNPGQSGPDRTPEPFPAPRKPLPDCLIPKLTPRSGDHSPVPDRVLETV